jgi:hypothetical protein
MRSRFPERAVSLARILCFALGLAPAVAFAQAEPSPVEAQHAAPLHSVTYPQLVSEGASAEAFAPAGWRVEFKASGDLNKDGIDDLALIIRQDDPANVLTNMPIGPAKLDTNPRILAMAFGRSGGGYDLTLQNHTLIPDTTEPNLDDYLTEGGGIVIARGTLQVKLHLFASAGGWSMGTVGYTFRFQNGRVELIGYDSDMTQRNSGETTEISVNYSTGRMKIATGSIENDKTKARWRTLPKPFFTPFLPALVVITTTPLVAREP